MDHQHPHRHSREANYQHHHSSNGPQHQYLSPQPPHHLHHPPPPVPPHLLVPPPPQHSPFPHIAAASKSSSYEDTLDDATNLLNERLSNGQPVSPNDVLSGRGKLSFNHGGNKRFRDAVTTSLDQYMKAETRFEKSLVVHSIIDAIHQTGGRFLKKDFDGNFWVEMSRQQCKEKVGHAIRDAVNSYEARRKKKDKHGPPQQSSSSTTSLSLLHKASSTASSSASSQLSTPAVRMSIAGLSNSTGTWKRPRHLLSPADDNVLGEEGIATSSTATTRSSLTVDTDYGASAKKRRRRSYHGVVSTDNFHDNETSRVESSSSFMRSAIPLQPSPIQSTSSGMVVAASAAASTMLHASASLDRLHQHPGVVQHHPVSVSMPPTIMNQPTLTYPSETVGDYQRCHQQQQHRGSNNNNTTGRLHFSFDTSTTTPAATTTTRTNSSRRNKQPQRPQQRDYHQIDDIHIAESASFQSNGSSAIDGHDPDDDDGRNNHHHHADHFELAIEAVLGPMPSREEEPSP